MIKFSCTHCNRHLEAEEDMSNTIIPCPACGEDIRVPPANAVSISPGISGFNPDKWRSQLTMIQQNRYFAIFKKATNIQPLLDHLKSGRVIRSIMSIAGRLVAVFLGLALLVIWLYTWKQIGELKFFGGLAFLIWQFSFPYGSFLAIKALYLRAMEINDYPDSDYVVVPIMAMLIKTIGEMIFIFIGVMSIPAMLLALLTGGLMSGYFDLGNLENVFIHAIMVFLFSLCIGFLALILSRLVAELTLALFSIANDVNIIRQNFLSRDNMPIAKASNPNPEK